MTMNSSQKLLPVLFSDESSFHLRNANGRLQVRQRCGDLYHNDCLVQTDRWGGGSVMVWRECHGVEEVSWCGAGSVIITEQHSMFVMAE